MRRQEPTHEEVMANLDKRLEETQNAIQGLQDQIKARKEEINRIKRQIGCEIYRLNAIKRQKLHELWCYDFDKRLDEHVKSGNADIEQIAEGLKHYHREFEKMEVRGMDMGSVEAELKDYEPTKLI